MRPGGSSRDGLEPGFARLGQWDSFQEPFEKARRLLKRADASVFATQACSRLLECCTLVLKNDIEHSTARAWESCPGALRLAEEVFSRCSTSPVFYPRVYHLKAYIFRMLGNEEQSLLCLNQGLQACEVYGNLLEKTWLEMSTPVLSSFSRQLPAVRPGEGSALLRCC
nr:PREDICTED: adenylate cyclase type 10-like [Apteryx mantelli mantelli]